MATIRLNNNDLQKMIQGVAAMICENRWYEEQVLCYSPYYVSINFSDHAIDRKYEREINHTKVINNVRRVIQNIIQDYSDGKLDPKRKVRIIDTSSCIITVCGIVKHPTKENRIKKLVVVTCFVWDGRINVDYGQRYYMGEESERYREVKQWNQENQDIVQAYMNYRRNGIQSNPSLENERELEKLSREYDRQTNGISDDERKHHMKSSYGAAAEDNIVNNYESLSPEDREAIADYFRNMNNQHIKLNSEELYEMVSMAVKHVVLESLGLKTGKRTFK